MSRKAVLVILMVANMLVTGTAWADFYLTGTQHMNVTSNHSTGALYDSSSVDISGGQTLSLGAWNSSTVNITGGYVGDLDLWNSSSMNISGGYTSTVDASDNTTVNITGGDVNGHLILKDTSSATFSGGNMNGYLVAFGSSSVTISGGKFRNNHSAWIKTTEYSTMNISDGYVYKLTPLDSSTVDVTGGLVRQVTATGTSSTVSFYGYDFSGSVGISFAGDTVLGTGELSGRWLDGTLWTTNINIHDAGSTILAVPSFFANAGGPYSLDMGGSIVLGGSATGAYSEAAWDLDLDGLFDDAFGLNPLISSDMLTSWGFSPGMTRDIGFRATSLYGNTMDISTTELTLTPVPPAIILGIIGLSTSGWILKRKRMI